MTVETHGMQFVVDASGVAKGFHDYESAVEGIFKSLDTFEKKVASTMSAVEKAVNNRAALAGFKKSLDQFSNINIDSRAASKLSTLSAAMAGFKAPSSTQTTNARKFFSSLANLPDLNKAYASIKNIGALRGAMENFKAPPLSQAKNLVEFAKAIEQAAPAFRSLQRISGVSGVAHELATISIAMKGLKVPSAAEITRIGNFGLALQHLGRANIGNTGQMINSLAGLGNFRAPSPAQIRNLTAFVTALHNLKPVTNAAGIASSITQITSAAQRANASLGGFRTNLGGFNPAYGRFNAGTHSARLEMMGLQNAFSGTFQVGSVLRSLLGSLTIGELGREFFKATQTANQFRASMEVLGMTPMMSGAAWERVRHDANQFGTDLATFSDGFSKFAVAAYESGMKIGESFKVYEGFQTVMSTLHLGMQQQQSVGLAIREIMDRGYVSTQQLTRQLGLVLPGAFKTLNDAWLESGKKGVTFLDALKKHLVDGQWALDKLSDHYKEVYGPALAKALESPIQQFNILKNNIMSTMIAIGDSGAKKGFADLVKEISGFIDPKATQGFAQAIGGGLTTALKKAAEGVRYLHDNWDSIKGPLGTAVGLMGKWMILSASIAIGRSILSPLLAVRTALMGFNTALAGTATRLPLLTRGFAALAAGTTPLASSFTRLRSNGLMANAMLNTMTSTSRTAGMQFRLLQGAIMAPTVASNALRVGFNGLKSVGSGLLNLVGGPWAAAMIGFGIAVAGVSSAIVELGMHHSEAQRTIESAAEIFQNNATLLGKQATNAELAKIGVTGFGNQSSDQTGPVKQFAGVVGGLADQLYRAADAARQANIADIQRKITETETTRQTRELDTMDHLFERRPGENNSLKHSWERGTHRIGTMIHNWWDDGEDDRAAHEDVRRANQTLKGDGKTPGLYQLLKQAQGESAEAFAKRNHLAELYDTGTPHGPIFDGAGAGGKKKKGKDPYTAINKTENAVDNLMKSLNAGDPIAKLYTDFTKTITKESKDLLTAPGHQKWLAQVRADGKTANGLAAAQTTALIHQLESGTGINQKNLADLEKRYGKTIPDIVRLLKNQLDDLHDHEVASMKKTIDDDNKAIIEARKKIAEFDPETKNNLSLTDTIEPFVQKFFKPDQYQAWYKAIQTGTMTAGAAFDQLKSRMIAAIAPGGAMHDQFMKLGISGQRLTQILSGLGAGFTYEAEKAKDSLIFGKELLDQKADELKLMGLSNDQAEIMKQVQGEVQKALAARQSVDAQWIADLKQQLELNQKLEHQMQRNQEFFAGNGIRSYLNGLQDVGSAINDLDKNFLGSLNEQLVSLGETGKFSFNKIFDTIRNGMIKMAADGLTKKFASTFFGEDKLNGGQPSFFGSTIGKWMGGYGPNQKDPYGSAGPDPKQVPWATNFKQLGVDATTGKLTGSGIFPSWANGQSATSPLYVRNADGGLGGGAGGGGGMFPSGNGFSYDKDGYLTPNSSSAGSAPFDMSKATDFSKTLGAIGGAGNSDPATAAGAKVAGSFMGNMASVMPMVGMLFSASFKSPIAQIGGMFLSMMMQKMMMSQASGAGGGGGGGGFLGKLLGIGMSAMGGGGGGGSMFSGADLAGGGSAVFDMGSSMSGFGDMSTAFTFREGGISHIGGVGSARISPAAFINAPHYREGTGNTSGIPAVLHDNEAVIPLSRGREVPVKLTNKQSDASGKSVQVNFTVHAADADSFQQSKQQIMADLHGAMVRSFNRNY